LIIEFLGVCKCLRQLWKFKWHGFELVVVTCFRRINSFAHSPDTVCEQYHLGSLMIRTSDDYTARSKHRPFNKYLIIFASQTVRIFCNWFLSLTARKKLCYVDIYVTSMDPFCHIWKAYMYIYSLLSFWFILLHCCGVIF
jgi:hypothetical protein